MSRAAARLVRQLFRRPPVWIAQAAALGDGTSHPSAAPFTIAFVTVIPAGSPAPEGFAWVSVQSLLPLAARQYATVTAGLAVLRATMDFEPIAFRMLPDEFTLSELQSVYELLLERRLHKASFRRALHGAQLVAPTEVWHTEGRGRPAQLYRYSPANRRSVLRPVRFELID